MRAILIGLAALATSAQALAGVSFTEYEAATQAAQTRASACRSELSGAGGSGEQCARFDEYMERYEQIASAFTERMMEEGEAAFDGANAVRMEAHGRTMERLSTSIQYITEMTR